MSKFKQLRFLPRVLNKKEKKIFLVFLLIFIISGIVLINSLWRSNTDVVPKAGGAIREGAVGQPRYLNPVYASSNDVDRDIVNLIYSGLFKYDEFGNIINDLVDDYTISEDGKIYLLTLKDNVLFHDGEKLTTEDVLFTIETIQNPDFQSPIQAEWLDVEAEQISDLQIKFTLRNPYPAFLETLTIKILPEHIWGEISSQNFPLSDFNFNPIGSGPFNIRIFNK